MLVGHAGGRSKWNAASLMAGTKVTTPGVWSTIEIPFGDGGYALLIGGGGGSAYNPGYKGQLGGAGAAVKVWLGPGRYRVWIGLGGLSLGAAAGRTDNSGYAAHGGKGGKGGTESSEGGSGGTPTILEKQANDGSWQMVAVAGAGGGGAVHVNSSTSRGGGGGTWSKHTLDNQLLVVDGGHQGTLGGGYGAIADRLAGAGGSSFYLGAVGFTVPGLAADVLNQWSGGHGADHPSGYTPGGGGGGGYGGGAGGAPGATTTTTATRGGYILDVNNVRWGGTGSGGGHSNSCGGGGGGGGSFYPLNDSRSGEVVGRARALTAYGTSSTTYRATISPVVNLNGLDPLTGAGGIQNQAGAAGGFVFCGVTAPF